MGRNQAQNQKMKDQRREQILSSALRLFATKGLAATKISDIAGAAGMSLGLVYHYYNSKEAIFTELIRNAFDRMNSAAMELERLPISPQEKIRKAITVLIHGLDANEDTGHYHLLIAVATASTAIPEAAKQIIAIENRVPYEIMTRIIRAGQQAGTIKNFDAEELALVFWTSIKGLAIHRATHGKNFKLPDPEIILNMFL